MSHTPKFDAKMKAVLDALTPGERTCALTGEKWMMTDEEIGWYKKFNVPPSPLSPFSRWIVLHNFSTGYQWWWNKHAETGKPVLTFHHPGSGIRVLPDVEWFEKDFSSIHIDWDASRNTFEQMRELQLNVPLIATGSFKIPENSVSLVSMGDQNSYFTLACESKDSFFATILLKGEECSEMVSVNTASQCHQVTHSRRVHGCRYVRESHDCIDSAFLFDCRNCESCFGATNQRNKKYLWFNEQLTKDEWLRRRKEVDLSCRDVVEEWSSRFVVLLKDDAVWPENFNEKSIDSIGEYLTESTNCRYCYNLEPGAVDNYWVAWGGISNGNAFTIGAFQGASHCYYSMNAGKSSGCLFSSRVIGCDGCEYCFASYHCKNCFGCFGLQRKQYCIFNKQYTEEEYWQKLDEIKCTMVDRGEYGQFFPPSMASSWKELSGAHLYCLVPLEQLSTFGVTSFEQCADGACGPDLAGSEILTPEQVPNCIREIDDSWTKRPIFDPVANRRFAFLKPELDHYRKFGIAPPNAYFVRRMSGLHEQMQAAAFETRPCAKCGKELMTSKIAAHPDRRVYCKDDYLQYLEERG